MVVEVVICLTIGHWWVSMSDGSMVSAAKLTWNNFSFPSGRVSKEDLHSSLAEAPAPLGRAHLVVLLQLGARSACRSSIEP